MCQSGLQIYLIIIQGNSQISIFRNIFNQAHNNMRFVRKLFYGEEFTFITDLMHNDHENSSNFENYFRFTFFVFVVSNLMWVWLPVEYIFWLVGIRYNSEKCSERETNFCLDIKLALEALSNFLSFWDRNSEV